MGANPLGPPKAVVKPPRVRKVRGVSALPTHADRKPGPSPEEAREKRLAKEQHERAARDNNPFGGFIDIGMYGYDLDDFSRAFANVGRAGGGIGRLLRASGFTEVTDDPTPRPSAQDAIAFADRLRDFNRTVTGRTASRDPDPATIPPARRLGLSGPEATIHDAARFGVLYGMGAHRLAALNQSRRIDVPGVTDLQQAMRLARERPATATASELRVAEATYDAIRRQAAGTAPTGDNVSTVYGIPIFIDPNVPDNEIRMVSSSREPRFALDPGAQITFLDIEGSFYL